MKRHPTPTRRQFLQASSAALLAGGLDAAGDQPARPALAIHGGAKAVKEPPPRPARWGEPERRQLDSMLAQDSLFYWQGPQTKLFIERFRAACPHRWVMTCSSGTAAIHIAVAATGIQLGDEVITSPVTDMGTVIGVLFQHAVPVFADLGASTYNLDPRDVERRITPRTKAIIAVHLAGNPCDLDALKVLADHHGLILIEDCAQAWGARSRGRPIGTVGHFACFSLQNSKHVTCGDGGVVASSDERFGPLLQRYGDKGFDRLGRTGLFEAFSTNYRMSEPQAAVAAAQLGRLDGIARRRALLGNLLSERIAGTPGIVPHGVSPEDRSTYWFYMLRVRPAELRVSRDELVKALQAEGVPAAAGYIPVPLYGNPVFRKHAFFAGRWPVKEYGRTDMDYGKVRCPEAEAILETGVRVHIHEAMSEEYVESLARATRKVAAHYAT